MVDAGVVSRALIFRKAARIFAVGEKPEPDRKPRSGSRVRFVQPEKSDHKRKQSRGEKGGEERGPRDEERRGLRDEERRGPRSRGEEGWERRGEERRGRRSEEGRKQRTGAVIMGSRVSIVQPF
ncbi:hypothetical protein GGTG_12167 [Gaeumannomyces tritici R3-111a-1]|uniref:Uncharacterized protein n=1 Tax=Gaeumannomyces tritici (strain R3-111a-1) TaxID=644352 RepID=J3PF88_GAET3|nr:hypothetical protein GGTG_12167 [Gaeumannomyces tritici R3-111a-1]EJT69990.1 hypothetical protein GGTG_12167 [Gaeumannomyces tritici R3-111a-1]